MTDCSQICIERNFRNIRGVSIGAPFTHAPKEVQSVGGIVPMISRGRHNSKSAAPKSASFTQFEHVSVSPYVGILVISVLVN